MNIFTGAKPYVYFSNACIVISACCIAISAVATETQNDSTTSAFQPVDLDIHEYSAMDSDSQNDEHILSKPWYKNFELHGFAAIGFYDTGSAGTKENLVSEIKEASLFIEADVWENTTFFIELQTNRLGKDEEMFARTGEVYIHFREIPLNDSSSMGLKLGRIDIPFGEEYLWQDSIDNPLISNSAAFPYGWDEGVLLYDQYKKLHWILAVTDGTDARSKEDSSDKAVNLKLYGQPTPQLYLSVSAMRNGKSIKSALEFGGSHFEPVGTSNTSTVGSSESIAVDGFAYEFDLKAFFSDSVDGSYISFSLGAANQQDDNSTFNRDFRWFSIEPLLRIGKDKYMVLRYSEVGTYDDNEGYHFDGKTTAGGNDSFGYDVKRFRRIGFGLGWIPNPRVKVKLEIGQDWFELIDQSPIRENDEDRSFFGLEVAVSF
ncbi:MAG: hypothetical protein ABGY96_16275 [bacterium]|nr:hypothetical protein [Gammaproteobacteria bacterium]HIL96516.1 hypothetical protein [Pseudomonadales bacterium]